MTDRGIITVNQLRADDGMEGWGGESEGCGRGRGTIYLDLKGEEVEEDTEEKDKWALMVALWARAGRAGGWLLR